MHDVLVLGAGKVGRLITVLLAESGDYRVRVADAEPRRLQRVAQRPNVETLELDAADEDELAAAMRGQRHVVSALSFRFNPAVARAARDAGLSYYDLTEDVETTRAVRAIADLAGPGQTFMPQCGLAPGFISIVANHLAGSFDRLDAVHMRVGALPQFPSNALRYNLTWSTDGLINEYCNPCEAIMDGNRAELRPLDGLEHFWLDGVQYEAFNTSGGLGTLAESLAGAVRELDYKTIRYPGHQALMRFLIGELRLGQRRALLKEVLETAIPVTFQDLVVTFCTVTGWRKDQLVQVADARKLYSRRLHGEPWSAIQITTAAGICAALDLALAGELPGGFVRQEQIDLDAFLGNRFGRLFHERGRGREASAEEEDI